MDNDTPSQISKLASKSRVYFGTLEGQESVKRPRLDEPSSSTSSGGGIDLEALGNL
jgi:U4/U6 small nuclear ribonucleoprotein PRP4